VSELPDTPSNGNCAEESYAARLEKPDQPLLILVICCKKSTFNKNSCWRANQVWYD